MKVDPRTRQSYLAAVVLAGITLFTFYTFRDYGPASAVRRFHEDSLSNNLQDLQQVCLQPVNSRDVVRLAVFLKELEESGSTPKWASMERTPNEVDLLVLYPQIGGSRPFVWVVDRQVAGWQVNATQTIRANQGLEGS